MENNKKSAGTIALVVLLLIVTIASLILATYAWAKYTTTESGSASANVAKWNVTLDEADKSITHTATHTVTGKIAPGTSGSFDIIINPGDTEVCFDYSILLSNATFNPSGSIGHLKFFADSAYTNEIVLGTQNTALTGRIDLDSHNNTSNRTPVNATAVGDGTYKVTIYWVWPYDREAANKIAAYASIVANETTNEAYDAVDTTSGETVTSMTVTYTTTATQVQPQ